MEVSHVLCLSDAFTGATQQERDWCDMPAPQEEEEEIAAAAVEKDQQGPLTRGGGGGGEELIKDPACLYH